MLFRQNNIEFTNIKESHVRRNYHFRVEIWYKTKELKTLQIFQTSGIESNHSVVQILDMYFELSMECRIKICIQDL